MSVGVSRTGHCVRCSEHAMRNVLLHELIARTPCEDSWSCRRSHSQSHGVDCLSDRHGWSCAHAQLYPILYCDDCSYSHVSQDQVKRALGQDGFWQKGSSRGSNDADKVSRGHGRRESISIRNELATCLARGPAWKKEVCSHGKSRYPQLR